MTSGIYAIERIETEDKYIGWSGTIENRFKKHLTQLKNNRHPNKYLQNAWNKYGEESFKFYIIDEYPPIQEILTLMEIYFVAYYDSFWEDGKGYNLTRGGEGAGLGYKPTEEEKLRNSLAHIGNHHTDEAKKKISIGMTGFKHSPESIEKQRQKVSGKNSYMWGTHRTQEQIDYLTSFNIGRKEKGASSIRIGVGYRKDIKKWNVQFRDHGVQIRLGCYKTEDEAARVHDDYVMEHNISRPLNFPEEWDIINKKCLRDKIEIKPCSGKNINSTSEYFGVAKRINKKEPVVRWVSKIWINKKMYYIGTFETEVEAVRAYDKYVVEHNLPHPLNFPEEWGREK